MNNVKELRAELKKVFQGVKNKKITPTAGKILVATSNAIMDTVKTELIHNKFLGIKKPIDFLSSSKK